MGKISVKLEARESPFIDTAVHWWIQNFRKAVIHCTSRMLFIVNADDELYTVFLDRQVAEKISKSPTTPPPPTLSLPLPQFLSPRSN